MRKNHHGKKDRLVKRVFALCLALAVICTCLVPVFATEGLIDPQVHQEASRPVDDGEASYPDDEFAGFGEEEATRPVDGGEAAGFGEDEVATRPVEGGEDNLDGGPTVTDSEWGTVIDYGTSTDPSSSTETQWSGEDDVVEKPDDKVVVSGDEIKKLQDMVVYRFWLKELNTLDLQDITAQAQINNMTESEYLARNGEVLWNLYFIQAVPRAETIADYSSYIENPSSNRDPKGELRQFDYWYTLDEFGNRVRLNLTDPTSNILDDKTTTVNVYAAWKDGTVGSDEEEDVDHEDLVDKNPVPVDLTAKASASYEDEEGNPKTTTLPVEVKNLPSAAHSLSVIHMGDDDMESFYESHEDDFGSMAPILGLRISPKNAKGNTVQPAKGEKAAVTVSGLDKLPEIAEMEEAGALTADALKVLHKKDDGSVETLDVLSYQNGTLTFETSSFSPFVLALTGGYDVETLESKVPSKVSFVVGDTEKLEGKSNSKKKCNYTQTWMSDKEEVATVDNSGKVSAVGVGTATIEHTYCKAKHLGSNSKHDVRTEKFIVTVAPASAKGKIKVYVYVATTAKDGSSWRNNTEFLKLLGISPKTVDANGYFPVGTIYLDESFLEGKSEAHTPGKPLIKTENDWNDLKTALSELDNNSMDSGVYVANNGNKVGEYIEQASKDYNETWGSQCTALFRWNMDTSYGFIDQSVEYHLDLQFETKNITFITGDNKITEPDYAKDNTKVDSRTYIMGSIIQKPENLKIPAGYEFAGYYKDYELTEEWNGIGTALNENQKVYIKIVPMTAAITITKNVTGLMADTSKEFTFQVTGGKLGSNTGDDVVVIAPNNNQLSKHDTEFGMKNGDTATVLRIPLNAVFCVKECKDNADDYKTTATGHTDEKGGKGKDRNFHYMLILDEDNKVVLMPCDEKGNRKGNNLTDLNIVVTNKCELPVDTGVLLDTLPYIVILAVVAGGVALLMLRKHRKEDD